MPLDSDFVTHIVEVFSRINLHNGQDAYENFEQISGLVKLTNFKVNLKKQDTELMADSRVVTNQQALEMIARA